MIEELHSYLLQHKSISIPGLGTIYVERIPAQSDFVNKQLLPPAFHFRFNKYFDAPNKEFFTYLASQKQIADYEAIKLYNEWALDFRNKIDTDQQAKWKGVGYLTKNLSGEIIFEPENPLNAFLEPVAAERTIRSNARHELLVGDRQFTNVEMTGYLKEEALEAKRRWWIYILAIAAIAAAALFVHFYRHGFSISSISNQQQLPVR